MNTRQEEKSLAERKRMRASQQRDKRVYWVEDKVENLHVSLGDAILIYHPLLSTNITCPTRAIATWTLVHKKTCLTEGSLDLEHQATSRPVSTEPHMLSWRNAHESRYGSC